MKRNTVFGLALWMMMMANVGMGAVNPKEDKNPSQAGQMPHATCWIANVNETFYFEQDPTSEEFLLGMTNALVGVTRRLQAARDPAATAKAWQTFLAGLAEGTVPLILAFALLAVAWLLAAVGLRKQA